MNAGSALTTPEAVVALRILRRAVLVIVLAAGLAVSACSYPPPGSESAAQVMPEVQAASETATSVHVAGSVRNGTQTTTMNVRIYGDSVAGTLGAYGTGFYVLSLNGASFVRLNAAFLSVENAPASLCAQICGRYVELPASSASQITGLLSMQQLISQVFNNKNMSTAAGSGCIFTPATLGGQAVLQCNQGSYTLDVAAHGKPYLLYWSGPHGQHLEFSEWNSVTLPTAPPASQVVSLSDLG
jgi:hypothetical protein